MPEATKRPRVKGAERTTLANDLAKAYQKGASIRDLADTHSRSYGLVRRLLAESNVVLRGRGGATRGRTKLG